MTDQTTDIHPPGRLHRPGDALHPRRLARRGGLHPPRRAPARPGHRRPGAGAARPVSRPRPRTTRTTGSSRLTVEAVARRGLTGRVPVIAGTGSNNTATAVEATRRAKTFGADAALVVAPYYNKPDQRMLEAHYRTVADEGGLPVVVYNVPGRTSCNVDAADPAAARGASPDHRGQGGIREPGADHDHPARPTGRLLGAVGR